MKKLIITVDTEGDNLWGWKQGEDITIENARYIERFQLLCEKYSFVPTYLINYEMVNSDILVDILKDRAKQGLCEIGMHLHAWNTPPSYELKRLYSGLPYITEYPTEIIREKHLFLKNMIENKYDIIVNSYRSGRWATNDALFDVLNEIGIKVDCSITPGINHFCNEGMSIPGGNNYNSAIRSPYRVRENLVEVPMTSELIHMWCGQSIKRKLRNVIKGREMWLRTASSSLDELIWLAKKCEHRKYLEFMIHSSELMPGGSPYFTTERSIEEHYKTLELFFEHLTINYEGISLYDYALQIKNDL